VTESWQAVPMPFVDSSETRQRRNVRLAVVVGLVLATVVIVAVGGLILGVFRGGQIAAPSGAPSVAFELDYKATAAPTPTRQSPFRRPMGETPQWMCSRERSCPSLRTFL
jgi:hypothetical protein